MEQGSHAEDIGPLVQRRTVHALRTGVVDARVVGRAAGLTLGVEIEADDLDLWFSVGSPRHDDGVGRQVSVDEPLVVGGLEPRGDLKGEVERLAEWKGLPRDEDLQQWIPYQLLQDHVGRAAIQLAHAIDRGDVRMSDPAGEPEQPRPGRLHTIGLGVQNEQHDRTAVQILRLVECALRSGAGSVGDAEAAGNDPADQANVAGTTVIERHRAALEGRRWRGTPGTCAGRKEVPRLSGMYGRHVTPGRAWPGTGSGWTSAPGADGYSCRTRTSSTK